MPYNVLALLAAARHRELYIASCSVFSPTFMFQYQTLYLFFIDASEHSILCNAPL